MASIRDVRPDITPVSLQQALTHVNVVDWGTANPEILVSGVTVDSSDVASGWIFVGISGFTHHGASYSQQAIANGAGVVVTDTAGAQLLSGAISAPVVTIEDPRSATPHIAAAIYGPYVQSMKLVSVTGTNGKTTTSYLTHAALSAHYGPTALLSTIEIVTGATHILSSRTTAEAPVVYRTLAASALAGERAGVVETSAHALSLHRVDGIAFDSAIFTNLQHDHLDYYHTMENYFEAKVQLFRPEHARRGVVCIDDAWGQQLAGRATIPVDTVSALQPTPPAFEGRANHWWVSQRHDDVASWGVSFTLHSPTGQKYACFCPILGAVNVQNAACAIIAATQLGVPIETAIDAIAHSRGVAGRMEKVPSNPAIHPRVLVDYAYTPEALEALLKTLRPLVKGRLIVVFGTDGDKDPSKREDLAAAAARLADDLWVTDENPRTEDPQQVRNYLLRGIKRVRPGMENVTEVTTCRRDAVREAIMSAHPGDLVAITGKGPEPYQVIKGVNHAYNDVPVALEVLRAIN
ncbi:MAG: UDP-N-acetylmuramoyl-L-alanyl-D-glutamate--2,6-diaminopimelate ligase [Ancrocorticia sp.]|jgi:UDP-N-acetylmuramoyl-L-alanyl-D-glutamate--2,6-diaminopimelate ligase|nr:UDP-N-acetylmuramoyl-L-alanyl-D-glutamate--2,6-diaminopimelate ligase [Ancrocorticia sp.]MCI1964160.1 UDP-N-acetylmuramoyl-L-alanyl-D-glutamate--2,6-diaminopimelate ligase [Ancrocorticia sp.]MCI2002597.1 UDP-N-acetylmuramoyl-L-alanyl-D-glutamate--2,6-diaminopimelate ligase [Ancrocorticia sp.]MCI2012574.1 UDP-N-acetylmuramoyl-L-alanyl-D-glutamate--2,6-diaminopimelate ligase [Ancrocorticia sp.]